MKKKTRKFNKWFRGIGTGLKRLENSIILQSAGYKWRCWKYVSIWDVRIAHCGVLCSGDTTPNQWQKQIKKKQWTRLENTPIVLNIASLHPVQCRHINRQDVSSRAALSVFVPADEKTVEGAISPLSFKTRGRIKQTKKKLSSVNGAVIKAKKKKSVRIFPRAGALLRALPHPSCEGGGVQVLTNSAMGRCSFWCFHLQTLSSPSSKPLSLFSERGYLR